MNDVDNLVKTGKPIVDAGMHHQVCVALMGLPFHDDKVHTPEFYIDIVQAPARAAASTSTRSA